MTGSLPFARILDPSSRPDPYPIYAELPDVPTRLADGRYAVRAHAQVLALLHDPRLSSVEPEQVETAHVAEAPTPSLLRLDPPEHDRLRRILMRQFGPPCRPGLVAGLEPEIIDIAQELLDAMKGDAEVEVVSDFAHRLPVAVICRLLGIPGGVEDRFGGWVAAIVDGFGRSAEGADALRQLTAYLTEIALSRRGGSGTDILTGLVNDDGPDGRLDDASVGAAARLLLIAGHETTVNLIGNGILTLLRHPGEIALLQADPERAVTVVEELLRYEPPVQFIPNRRSLADIAVGGMVIPAGSTVMLLLAAANRDPCRFAEPNRFDPDRASNAHLGFGSGIHSCFGAPLARLEGQIALRLFFDRVVEPRLLAEPPYRPSPVLRGPRELRIAFRAIRDRDDQRMSR